MATNLYETKTPVSLDSLEPDTPRTGSRMHEGPPDLANAMVKQSMDQFRNAVKDEITNRELSREELTGSAAMAMVGAFTKAADTKRAYAQSLEDLSKYYLVDALLNLIADETLITDIMTGEIVQLQGTTKEIDDELQILQRRLNVDQMIEDVTFDLLRYGDYTLRMEIDSENGVTGIADDVKQENVVAMYRHGMPEKFLIREKAKIRILSANTHLHFALGRSKLRVDLGDEFNIHDEDLERLRSKLPNYIRVGRPLLYGVQSKLKELQLLEALVPASKLHQLSTGSLVGVSVPSQTDPKEAFQISRRYESLLNSKTALDKRTGTLADVGDILATAGRTKVVPVMGEKGNLQTIDVKENRVADDMLSSIRDIRATICSTIGVPPELLFGSDSPESKGEFLKRHARYLRKIKSIQQALTNGLKQLALAHLLVRGIPVMPQDVQVVFRNEIVNIDELDKLEFADQVSQMTSDLWMFMQELDQSEQFQGRIDWEALSDWMRRHLALMGSNRSFIKPISEDMNEDDGGPTKQRRRKDKKHSTDDVDDEVFKAAIMKLAESISEQEHKVTTAQPASTVDGITPVVVVEEDIPEGSDEQAPDATDSDLAAVTSVVEEDEHGNETESTSAVTENENETAGGTETRDENDDTDTNSVAEDNKS